ncbi:MAG: hypothetical protein EZS28_038382 [Streblomastix strix]|uniref:Uncharacterized protein n=1 Tax=Streblomastix strix TaxID=222440 RepID=A0A5J4U859_9EUKA|nr:MAG: hypothetical protein EZS28_038382 [Streblomastix strix]
MNKNSQQTHTNFEANTNRLIGQLQRENIDYSNTIQYMEPRLVPQDKQYDYIYSIELINEDIDGKYYKVHRLHKNSINKCPAIAQRSTVYIDNLPIAVTINHDVKDMLNDRGIKMKKLSFTIPSDQDDTEIMNLIRQTVTQRSIH